MRHRSRAFSFIEVLIVAAVLAILAAIAFAGYSESHLRTKISRTHVEMRIMSAAIESYAADNKSYPPFVNGRSVFFPNAIGNSSRLVLLTTPVAYIPTVLRDPFNTIVLTTPGYDTYDFVAASSFTSGASPRGAAVSSGYEWHLVSLGPDKIMAFGGGVVGINTQSIHRLGVDYDPTNGTLSAGDIVRGNGKGPLYNYLPAIDRVSRKYNGTW